MKSVEALVHTREPLHEETFYEGHEGPTNSYWAVREIQRRT